MGRLDVAHPEWVSDGMWLSEVRLTVVKVGRSGSQGCPVVGVLVSILQRMAGVVWGSLVDGVLGGEGEDRQCWRW